MSTRSRKAPARSRRGGGQSLSGRKGIPFPTLDDGTTYRPQMRVRYWDAMRDLLFTGTIAWVTWHADEDSAPLWLACVTWDGTVVGHWEVLRDQPRPPSTIPLASLLPEGADPQG